MEELLGDIMTGRYGKSDVRMQRQLIQRIAQLERLCMSLAERVYLQHEILDKRAEYIPKCFACGYPNKPDGTCSRSGCCNDE